MEARVCAVALCLIALSCVSAQKTPVRDELQKRGYTHFLALADAAGIQEPAPSAVLTIFAPTNEAIDKFLQGMKLSLDDAKQRPGLSAAVMAYHVLPRVKGKTADVQGFSEASPLEAITADGFHFLRFFKDAQGRVVMKDVQNHTANVIHSGSQVGNALIYGIDKVMLSGDVFLTLDDLLSRHPQFQPLRALFDKAGLEDEVKNMQGSSNTITVWAPTADAVKAAQPQLSALSQSEVRDVLRYHIVPQGLAIPAALEAGKSYPTAFKGHDLKFKYISAPSKALKSSSLPKTQQQQQQERKTVEVIPEAGTFSGKPTAGAAGPQVTLANLFANRMVIHGINQVLKPNLPSKAAASTVTEAASKTSDKKASATAEQSSRARRKLVQFRLSQGPSTVSAGLTTTQSSIRAAVAGDRDTGDVAAFGTTTARAAANRCWNCIVDDSIGK